MAQMLNNTELHNRVKQEMQRAIMCSTLVTGATEATECGHRKDYPIIMKKRVKRFLFPQLLILNTNNQCGCRNANRYRYGIGGGGLPYGGGIGGGTGAPFRNSNLRKAKLIVDRRRLLRAQPIRSAKRSINVHRHHSHRSDGKRKANNGLQNKRNFGG